MHTRLVFAAVILAACGGGSTDDTVKIASISPAFAPLGGGNHIVITGQGFLRDGAAPNHVVIGSREAPLAAASDDQTLEVDTPPGEKSGDVPVVVFNRNGEATAMGMFHYSAGPTIAQASPSDVVYNSTTTTVTLTGTGFMDEDAGVPTVTVHGISAVDIKVLSDTQLSFTPPFGAAGTHADVVVTNNRGSTTKTQGLRYIPFTGQALFLYAKSPSVFGYFYDPVGNQVVKIPRINQNGNPNYFLREVLYDAQGTLWAIDNNSRNGGCNWGKLNFETQQIDNPKSLSTGYFTSLAKIGSTVYVTNINNSSFSTFNLETGAVTQISTTTPCCGNALAYDGTTMYFTNNAHIATINPTTGALGTSIALAPPRTIEEMHFMNGMLYGTSQWRGANSTDLFTINPTTGAVTVVHTFDASISAIEIFQ